MKIWLKSAKNNIIQIFNRGLHAKKNFLCKGLKRIPNFGMTMKGTHRSFTDNNMKEPTWAALTI